MLRVDFIVIGGMEAWRSRFKESQERCLEDDEDDDANMEMAVDQFHNFIDYEAPSRRAVGGSRQGKAANIERDRVIMDVQMYKDYFVDRPTHGPHIFWHRYRMRRSFFCYILERMCARDGILLKKRWRWITGVVFTPEDNRCTADASIGSVCRCHGRLLPNE